jgi:hypothetical protein
MEGADFSIQHDNNDMALPLISGPFGPKRLHYII